GVSVHDIEVKNSVLDGVNFASNQYLPSGYFTTKNVTCRNVYSHDNWRDGWGVTGALDGLLMDTCTAERCGDGADFETDEAGLPISNVDHVNCQFLSNAVPGGSGVSLAPTATGPFTNFRFTRCNWNWNLFHVLGQASFGATNVTFDDCFAINSLNHGIVLSPNAGTFVASINTFRDNGWPIGNTTDMNFYIPGSAVGIDIIIQDGSVDNASVLLSGNRHLGNAVDTGGNYAAVKLES